MKPDSGRIDAFLQSPTVSVILIFGPDAGLVAERGLTAARGVAGAMADPFRFAELHSPDAGTFLGEATAASLTGGVVSCACGTPGRLWPNRWRTLLKTPPEALVILEAGELTAKSRLRALCEKSAAAAACACYALDPARLPGAVTSRLRAQDVMIDADAANWVGQNVSGEEGPLRQAIELLVLYAGPDKTRLTLTDVAAALADGGDTSISDAVDAALTGDAQATDRALTMAYDEGVSPIGILRVLLTELLRLRVAAGAIAAGASTSEAMSAMRPPVFFKRQAIVTRALSLWSLAALGDAIRAALAAETACKQTLIPEHAFCRQTMLALASRARRK